MICAVAIIAITVGVAMQNKGRVRRKTHTYISKRKKEVNYPLIPAALRIRSLLEKQVQSFI